MTIARGNYQRKELVSQGPKRAICIQLIELGVLPQRDPKYPAFFKVMIGWELCDERIEVEEDGEKFQRPRVQSKEYTLLLTDRANLRKDLTSWRGREFTAEELEGLDMATILDQPANVTIVHKQNPQGETYARIEAIGALRPDEKPNWPERVNEILHYEISEGMAGPNWERLPRWVKEKISTSEEFTASAKAQTTAANNAAAQPAQPAPTAQPQQPQTPPAQTGGLPEDDDLPF